MFFRVFVLSLLGISASVFAGEWQVKVGASVLAPSSDHNTMADGAVTEAKADHAFSFTPSIEYFFANRNISSELLLATPFKHNVLARVAGGAPETIASFKQLPPTLTVKYHFKNSTGFTPYVGVGATALLAWDEQTKGSLAGTSLKAERAYGFTGQVGFNFQPADAKHWGVFADVRYADIGSDLKWNGEKIGTLEVNPWVYSVGYSYNF